MWRGWLARFKSRPPRPPAGGDQPTREAFDAVSCAIIMVNAQGQIELANLTAHRMFGYDDGELHGCCIEQLVPLDRRSAHAALRGGYLRQPVRRTMGRGLDLKGQRRDGSLFAVEIDLSPLATSAGPMVLATVIDATELRHMAEQDSRIAAIANASGDAIVGKDLNGVITSWNPAAERIFGYRAEEAIGQKVLLLFPPGHEGEEAEILRRVSRGETVNHLQVTRVRKDGSLIDISASIAPVRNRLGVIIGAAKVARDVTQLRIAEQAAQEQRRRQEAQRQRHVEELERINRELEDFAYAASHDLRAPLRAVSALAQWIDADDPSIGAATRERLQLIRGRVQRLTTLLDDMLDFARAGREPADSGERQSVATLAAEVMETLGAAPRFTLRCDPSVGEIFLPAMPIKRVLHNLIDNAIKHHDGAHGVIAIAAEPLGAGHRFSVTDDGPGIAPEYRSVVFEMFKTLRSRDEVEGSGMGLALVRKLVLQRGGRCGVDTPPGGRGSKFWFDWPTMGAIRRDDP